MEENNKKSQPLSDEVAVISKDVDIFSGWVDHLENPDPTVMSEGRGKGLKLYDEIDRDPHASAVLQTRYLSVAGEQWEIMAGEESAKGKAIADFVTDQLQRCNFKQAAQELLQGILYGFFCGEVMWKVTGGQVGIEKIIGKHPRRFAFTMERELRLITRESGLAGAPVPDRKFITFSYGDSDNPYGKGLGQKLWWSVWFKKHGIKFWLIFLDKFGMPTGVGKYPAGATTEQKKTLHEAIDAIHSETGVVIPDSMAVELLEASRSGNVTYESLCEYMDKQISKAVLGQNLTTEVSGGSLAAAKTHDDVRMEIKDADAGMLAECLNRSLIPWLVDYNFAGVSQYPTIRFITEKEETLKDLAERDAMLVNEVGLPLGLDYFYEKYNLPRPKAGEAVAMGAAQERTGDTERTGDISKSGTANETAGGNPAFAESDKDLSDYLLDHAKTQTATPAASLLDAAEALLNKVDTLEQFRDQLIDLYGQSDPERLAEVMARMEMLGNMGGRMAVVEEVDATI